MAYLENRKKINVQTILKRKQRGTKVTVLTAYDYLMARLLDQAGIDIILVGDSASNVIHGHRSTLPITVDIMVAHTAAVARGTDYALVVADMPFLSFQPSIATAVENAGRFLKEAGAEAVKMEGGIEMVETVRRVVECGIPVMGHVGLTPQSIHSFGGPKIQGREERSVSYLKKSALALQEAGCFAMVLELMKSEVAADITSSLESAVTIGIGAGPDCDGQVLVINDILGLRDEGFKPKFLRQYADLAPIISGAVQSFIKDVKDGDYPSDEESY